MSEFLEYGVNFILTWKMILIFSMVNGILTGLMFWWGIHSERSRARRCNLMMRRVAALPHWQRLCIELHIQGYNMLEIAGSLQLTPDDVLKELTIGYAVVRAPTRFRPPLRVRIAWACKTFIQLVSICGSAIFKRATKN